MFFLINKPTGITSHDVIYKMRKALHMKRIGHAGTLDPLASGLMIVATGTDTKLLEYVVGMDKTYQCTAMLGATSSTYDSEGTITPTTALPPPPSLQDIKRVIREFTGDIDQTPPQYSAVKIQGKKAYEYAREGQTISIPSRQVSIYSIEILEYNYPTLSIQAHVSSGTYIRSLLHDIGQRLNCGAYVTKLIRTSIGNCEETESINLDQLTDSTPPVAFNTIRSDLESYQLDEREFSKLQLGQAIAVNTIFSSDVVLGIYQNQIVSVLLYKPKEQKLFPHKNLLART